MRVLDVGAGSGVVPLALARAGLDAVALDTWAEYEPEHDNQMGRTGELLVLLRAGGVTPVVHDVVATGLPFEEHSFDIVTCYDVIEHLPPSPRRLLGELYRVLRPGGYLALTTPNHANLQARLRLLLGRTVHFPIDMWYDADPYYGHIREYTPAELRYLVRRAGFRTVVMRLSNAPQWNTRLPDGEWAPRLRPTSAFQLAKIVYFGITGLIPSLRFGMHVLARRPEDP
jgi:SAM-dependent methyltransferase